MKVESSAGKLDSTYVRQTFRFYPNNNVYVRYSIDTGFTDWELMPTRSEIDALNNSLVAKRETVPRNTDIDTLLAPGTYLLSNGFNYTNTPSQWGILIIFQPLTPNSFLAELLITDTAMFSRYRSTNEWLAWKKYTSTAVS